MMIKSINNYVLTPMQWVISARMPSSLCFIQKMFSECFCDHCAKTAGYSAELAMYSTIQQQGQVAKAQIVKALPTVIS